MDCLGFHACPQSELLRILAHVRGDQALLQHLNDALTADEVSLLAQELGFRVSGCDILRFGGKSASEGPASPGSTIQASIRGAITESSRERRCRR